MTQEELSALGEKISAASQWIPAILREIQKEVIGQQSLIERLLIGLLSDGHILLEGVPGLPRRRPSKRWQPASVRISNAV